MRERDDNDDEGDSLSLSFSMAYGIHPSVSLSVSLSSLSYYIFFSLFLLPHFRSFYFSHSSYHLTHALTLIPYHHHHLLLFLIVTSFIHFLLSAHDDNINFHIIIVNPTSFNLSNHLVCVLLIIIIKTQFTFRIIICQLFYFINFCVLISTINFKS